MNKLVLSFVILAVVVAALFTTGSVFAQGPAPQAQSGAAMGRGPRGGQAGPNLSQEGFLHDDLIAYYAEQLGLSVDELNTRLASGETLSQIAFSTGLSVDEFRALMVDARAAALDQAVTDGSLTQAQADWMAQHGAGVSAGGAGRGMRGAAAGSGLGQFANPDCPYTTVTPAQ